MKGLRPGRVKVIITPIVSAVSVFIICPGLQGALAAPGLSRRRSDHNRATAALPHPAPSDGGAEAG